MAAATEPTLIDEFERLSKTLEDEFDERGSQFALRDWSLFSNWVMQFIAEAKEIPNFMEELYSKITLGERVAKIIGIESLRESMETSAEEMINICETVEQKNLDKTRIFLRLGMKFFGLEKYKRAVEMFNMGLVFSPQPQDVPIEADGKSRNMFSMLLANRCRAFRKLKRFEQSLDDLDMAIKFAVDPKFAETLSAARKDIVADLEEHGPSRGVFDKERFEIGPDCMHRNLHGAVKLIAMQFNRKLGRHLITTEAIREGVAIISEAAYAHWLAPSHYNSYCAHCLRPLNDQPFPCRFCIYFRFCNEHCFEESWNTYHSNECKYMPILKYFANAHLALRIVQMNGIETCMEAYFDVMAKQLFPVEARMIYRSRLKDILTFVSHEELIDKMMTTGTFTAAFLTIFCRSIGMIDEEVMEEFGGFMLKLLAIIRVNSLLISDNTDKDQEGGEFVSPGIRRSEIGAGLFGATSFVNHSCEHNCTRVFIGNRMIISAKRDIKAFEQITITYGPSKERMSYCERQSMLLHRYFFKCACTACTRRA